jgi:Xaa-Pro aminopeptidase
LASSRFDMVVLTDPANVAYATGYRSVAGAIFSGHRMAALVSAEDLLLVAPAADGAAAIETAVAAERFHPYGRFFFESSDGSHPEMADRHPDFESALTAALDSAPFDTIGVDAGLDPDMAGNSAEPIAGWMNEVRSIKLPEEIGLLTTSAQLAESGIDAAISAASPGVTERELEAVVAGVMVAGRGHPRFVVVTSGERSALSDARATDRSLREGDLVRFDVGCTYEGYWSDVGRTAVVGPPDSLQQRRYEAILAGEEAQLGAAGPGLAASDLFRVAVDSVEASGIRPYRRHHCGHGIGTEVYEIPVIAPGTDLPLAEGMVLCVETPFYELGWGGMMVEDTLVVTGNGNRRITGSDRSLRVIEA